MASPWKLCQHLPSSRVIIRFLLVIVLSAVLFFLGQPVFWAAYDRFNWRFLAKMVRVRPPSEFNFTLRQVSWDLGVGHPPCPIPPPFLPPPLPFPPPCENETLALAHLRWQHIPQRYGSPSPQSLTLVNRCASGPAT